MKDKRILPPTFFNTAIVLIVLLHFFFPIMRIISFPWNLLGIFPALVGVVLNLHTDNLFKKHATTVKPFEESSALVTNGLFRLSRNPMYLGMGLILLGICIFLGSVSPYSVVLTFLILVDIIFISDEEKMLSNKFGPTWLEYKKEVRRWL